MSTTVSLDVTALPMGDAGPLDAYLGGTNATIPVVRLRTDWPGPTLAIQLSNHDDPARWLRESAAALLSLAEQVDARVTTDA